MREKICGIYLIQNKINKKAYIGSSNDILSRWKYSHKNLLFKNKHGNEHLQRAWNKYGKDNFSFFILYKCYEDKLLDWEQFFIDRFQSADRRFGYNIIPKADRSEVSEETKKKISLIKMGHKVTNETKNKIGIANSKIKPDWVKRKFSEARKKLYKNGYIHPCLGKKIPEERRIKIMKAMIKPVLMFDKNGNFIKEYNSIKEAIVETKIMGNTIVNHCKGRIKNIKKFTWKYKYEKNNNKPIF